MLRLSANISTLFTEYPLEDRFAAAAAAGFTAVEIQFPYDCPAGILAAARAAAGVEVVLINLPAGKLDEGELGIACLPDRRAQFAESLAIAAEYCAALGCARVNCLAGIGDAGHCWPVLVDNVALAAGMLERHGIGLLVEMINRVDQPGFVLNSLAAIDRLLPDVGSGNLALQFDLYHVVMNGEDWPSAFAGRLPRIGHVQFSDAPGRGPPGSGTIDFPGFFAAVARSAYAGWTGAEYRPVGSSADSLAWRDEHDALRR